MPQLKPGFKSIKRLNQPIPRRMSVKTQVKSVEIAKSLELKISFKTFWVDTKFPYGAKLPLLQFILQLKNIFKAEKLIIICINGLKKKGNFR